MNPALLLVRFGTTALASKVSKILTRMYAAHRALVTGANYDGPGIDDRCRVHPSPPMRAVGAAHGFEWPAGDGISIEPDSQDRFSVVSAGNVVVVHHPYALQIGEAGIAMLAATYGADVVLDSGAHAIHVQLRARGPAARETLARLTDPDYLPHAAALLAAKPRQSSLVLELDDAHFLQFEPTIEGHESFVECMLGACRTRGVTLWIEPPETREQIAQLSLCNRDTGSAHALVLERIGERFAVGTDEYATLREASAAMRRAVLELAARRTVVVFEQPTFERLRLSLFREAYRAHLPDEVLEGLLGTVARPDVSTVERAPRSLVELARAEPRVGLRVAITAPLGASELAELLSRHATWLTEHRDLPHIWIAMYFPHDFDVAVDALDDPTRTSLSRRDLRGLSFENVDLSGAQLLDSIADDVSFRGANLSNAFAAQLRARGAVFDGATLRDTDFSRSDLTRASFKNADCRGADFENCILEGADFSGADLTDALHLRR